MTRLVLKTFQPLHRVRQLQSEGCLRGDWRHVPGAWEQAYRLMVARMEAFGIDCEGCPPVWAWLGHVTRGDAFGLLNPEEGSTQEYATITFMSPSHLVLLSDYTSWCDALTGARWPIDESASDLSCPRIAQATLPRIELEWVESVTPISMHDVYEQDWDEPV